MEKEGKMGMKHLFIHFLTCANSYISEKSPPAWGSTQPPHLTNSTSRSQRCSQTTCRRWYLRSEWPRQQLLPFRNAKTILQLLDSLPHREGRYWYDGGYFYFFLLKSHPLIRSSYWRSGRSRIACPSTPRTRCFCPRPL